MARHTRLRDASRPVPDIPGPIPGGRRLPRRGGQRAAAVPGQGLGARGPRHLPSLWGGFGRLSKQPIIVYSDRPVWLRVSSPNLSFLVIALYLARTPSAYMETAPVHSFL